MAQSNTPNTVAAALSRRLGRPVSPKSIRGWARANMSRLSKATHPANQSHEYNAAEVQRITAAFIKRAASAPAPVAKRANRTGTRRARPGAASVAVSSQASGTDGAS